MEALSLRIGLAEWWWSSICRGVSVIATVRVAGGAAREVDVSPEPGEAAIGDRQQVVALPARVGVTVDRAVAVGAGNGRALSRQRRERDGGGGDDDLRHESRPWGWMGGVAVTMPGSAAAVV